MKKLLSALTTVFIIAFLSSAAQAQFKNDTSTSKYTDLYPQICETITSGFYAPQQFSQPRWQQFWIDVRKALATSNSEQELSRKFSTAANSLGISHFNLYRVKNPSKDEATSVKNPDHVTLKFRKKDIAVLTVHGMFNVSQTLKPLTKAFAKIAAKQPNALIIDLRKNRGGDLSSMLLVGHLVSESTVAGLFLSRTWWKTHDEVPARSNWDSLPHLRKPNLKAFFSALKKHGALVGVVPPMKPSYEGPVYVLTSPITASATEPVVYLLKQTGRATIVGQRTAGAMLSSETAELSDGWMLQYPTANFYTPQMSRIDQVGVKPDIVVPVQKALEKALKLARN